MQQAASGGYRLGPELLTAAAIQARVAALAGAVSRDYDRLDRPLILLSVLKGSVSFATDLGRSITVPVNFDYVAVSSYGQATVSSGHVMLLKDLSMDVAGRHGARGKHAGELGWPRLDQADGNQPAHRGSTHIDAGRLAELRGEEPQELVGALGAVLQHPVGRSADNEKYLRHDNLLSSPCQGLPAGTIRFQCRHAFQQGIRRTLAYQRLA